MSLGKQLLKVERVNKIVAISSGKGGVGKSTIAVNIAVGLTRLGFRIGLLDADVHGPNVPLMMGVRRKQASSGWAAMVPLATGPADRQHHMMPALDRFGVRMMSVGLLVGEDQSAMFDNVSSVGWLVRNLLTMVDWGDLDLLLLDFPPGTSEPQATLLKTVKHDGALIVVTPQDLSQSDSTRTMHSFEQTGVPVKGIIENMSYFICPHCGEPVDVFNRGTVVRPVTSGSVPLLGKIPLDPALSEAADTGRPVLISNPESRQAAELLALSQAVAVALDL